MDRVLEGVCVGVVGDLLATRVTIQLLSDAGARVEPYVEGLHVDILLGDRPSFTELIKQKSLEPVLPGVRALVGEAPVILEFTHRARGDEADSSVPSERGAASDSGLYESLVPFFPPNVFDQPVCSYVAGIEAAMAVVAADHHRKLGARATELSVPLVGGGYSLLGLQSLFAFEHPTNWRPVCWMASPFKDAWRCQDGNYIYLHVGLSHHLSRFLEVLSTHGFVQESDGLRALMSEQTLSDPVEPTGFLKIARVVKRLQRFFATKDAAYWESILSAGGLCCIRIRSFEEWAESDLAEQCGFVSRNASSSDLQKWKYESFVRMTTKTPAADRALSKVSCGQAPLSGMRVLDFAQVIAGPLAGRTLLELGAEVIRVENPRMKQAFVEPFSAAFHAGKRVVEIDLRSVDGRDAVSRLIREWCPHVVLHNFGLGVAEKLGISEDQIRSVIPDVIYLDINAFGDKGPLAKLPGFEQTAQALCGVASESSKNGRPSLFLLPIHDMGAGLLGAFGVVCAWRRLMQSGGGAHVHTSLASASMLLQSIHPKRISSSEMLEKPRKGLRFTHLFRKLEVENHWMMEKVILKTGEFARVVHMPVWSSDWRSSRFQKEGQGSLAVVGARVSFLQRLRARLLESAWGLWWLGRQLFQS